MSDVSTLIDEIESGERPVDILAAIIPKMMELEHRLLPEFLAYVIAEELWRRWGYPGPGEYFKAIGVALGVQRQAQMIILECATDSPAYAAALGPNVVGMIRRLQASNPATMSEREFACRMKTMAAVVAQAVA